MYKGLSEDTKQVVVNPDNICEASYSLGKRYLVFGSREAGTDEVRSGACDGSRLADGEQADVQFLETYRLKQATNFVFGRVLQSITSIGRSQREEEAPVEGAKVSLSSASGALTQPTTAAGDFRFENIPPGSYSLAARLEPYTPNPASISIQVPAVGCVEAFPLLEAGAKLSGVLLDEFGEPAPEKRIELLRRNRDGKWYRSYDFWKQTDGRGQFAFEGLPDGDYLLGYEIWSDKPSHDSLYPTTYFPGVSDRASASVLHLAPRQAIGDLRIPLPKPHTPRRIHVEVVWPDDKAPARNLLQLFDGRELLQNVGVLLINRPSTPHNGIIDFTGAAERYYDLHVRYWIDDAGGPVPGDEKKIARSEVVRLSPGKEPASVKLVLTRTLLAVEDH